MRDLFGAVGALLLVVAQLLFFALVLSTTTGAVREHCADVQSSERLGFVDVDSNWTYIVWPPLIFSSLDPAGYCVRNSPLREGLAAIGVWDLPSPEEQVRRHVLEQVRGEE